MTRRLTGDEINAALDETRQALIRAKFRASKHYVGPSDTFDEIAGSMFVRRDDKAAIVVVPDGEYGS